ncbi:phospholipase D-like domain-containing protein [Aquabacterium sp.]|uniref:phospholipase D-like domain-containing protein n=1 Tax=Aquabacterium sp. TaxID=1872578 RepID=UPI003D6D9016
MPGKTIHQPVDKDGKPTAQARSAPAWFPKNTENVRVDGMKRLGLPEELDWGQLFSEPHRGNDVDFYVTGEEYFKAVAGYIRKAKKTVFIAGWQVNYDVELDGKTTLFDCLREAVDNGASVYVMPWLSPKAGVDTGDFETMLAVFQLNAGKPKGRAYCLPAMQQGDQGSLGLFFSHHQKQVVVDNKHAFVGGIDLAYGRRDDGNFSLKPEGRTLNELYNSCIPPVHDLSNVEQADCLTRAELLAACTLDGLTGWIATFLTSPADLFAPVWDAKSAVTQHISDAKTQAMNSWENSDLLGRFTGPVKKAAAGAAQDASRWAWAQLPKDVQEKLQALRDTGSANAANAMSALLAWLNNADLNRVPPAMLQEVSSVVHALSYAVFAALYATSHELPKRYERLLEHTKVTPKSGKIIDVDCQPRMPWHDVHCHIKGSAVFDLSMNFVRRWNGSARSYEKSFARYRDPYAKLVDPLLEKIGLQIIKTPKAPRIAKADFPVHQESGGSNWVQVVRSAPKQLVTQENAELGANAPAMQQNNCLKAMIKVIQGSSKFIYIEGQFFQTAYGDEGEARGKKSGPMDALLTIESSTTYQQCIDMLGIRGLPISKVPTAMRWDMVPEVMELAHGKAFMADLKQAMTNATTIEALRLMGKPQERLLNPIGQALVDRITQAIYDDKPFHVYMVLPVHPEGLLNVVNIMTQTHLTMQSLVFGKHSLVNGIRRGILAKRLHDQKKISIEEAEHRVAGMDAEAIQKACGKDWTAYLTLLNLRNWDVIGKKPVTEQIYVHSKLLIADDRVAVLGSANINDRSQLGSRDSELAVVITDDTPIMAKLDGVNDHPVASKVHDLRVRLWRKLFGLTSTNRRSEELAGEALLKSPAASSTQQAIQYIAEENAKTYEAAFWFIPRNLAHPKVQPIEANKGTPPSSIWPLWRYVNYAKHESGGRLAYRMPFDELFWRRAAVHDIKHTYEPAADSKDSLSLTKEPNGIQGFITSLPVNWTAWENNLSSFNLTVIAMEHTSPSPTMVGSSSSTNSNVAINTNSPAESQAV